MVNWICFWFILCFWKILVLFKYLLYLFKMLRNVYVEFCCFKIVFILKCVFVFVFVMRLLCVVIVKWIDVGSVGCVSDGYCGYYVGWYCVCGICVVECVFGDFFDYFCSVVWVWVMILWLCVILRILCVLFCLFVLGV